MTQKLLPPNTILNEQARPFIFDAPPLFYKTLDYFAPATSLHIEAIQQEQAELAMRLQKRGVVEKTMSQIRNTTSAVGHSLRPLYDSTTQKLADEVNEMKWSLISLVLWIVIPAVILLLCIGVCVIYVKLGHHDYRTSRSPSETTS
ncbi:hypothetical protein Aduo_018887 [Ancylostoma duodenale]